GRIRKQQLRTMPNDPSPLLLDSRQKPGNIHKGEKWNIECVTEPHKSSCFIGSVDVQNTRHHNRLICNYSYRPTLKPAETDHNVRSKTGLNLEKVVVVHY